MSKKLLEQATTKLHENSQLRKQVGSIYHDDYLFCDRPASPQSKLDPNDPSEHRGHPRLGRKLPAIDECIVPFIGERTVKFVGPCAKKAFDTLQDWHAKYAPKKIQEWSDMNGSERKIASLIPGLKIEQVDGVDTLKLWKDTWNDWILVLYQKGVGLTGLPGDE